MLPCFHLFVRSSTAIVALKAMTGEEDEEDQEGEDEDEEEEEEEEEDSADDMRMFRDSGDGERMLAEGDMLEDDQASGMSCLPCSVAWRAFPWWFWLSDGVETA